MPVGKRTGVLIVLAALVIAFGAPAMCAAQSTWKLSGDSTFKVYWQTNLRIANETNLAASGSLGPLRLEGRMRLVGFNWGIPSDAIVIGPWGEKIDKWTLLAGRGGLSLQAGDTAVPVLSGLYLAGRSLYGAVVTTGGKLGNGVGTATGFYGVNAVSSGLSISAHRIAGGAAEFSLGRGLGLSVQGMQASKDQFQLYIGGAKAWTQVGKVSLTAETAVSKERVSEDLGWTALGSAQTQAFGGTLSLTGQYTSGDFITLNTAALGKAGGCAEATAVWSGPIYRGKRGLSLNLGITGKLAADNIDGSLASRTSSQSGEGVLTLVTGHGWVFKGKYQLAHDGSNEEPSSLRNKNSRVASLEAAVPFEVGDTVIDFGARASRATNVDEVADKTDVLDTMAFIAKTTVGKTAISTGATWCQSAKVASLKQDMEASLSISRPIADDLLRSGVDAKFTGARELDASSSSMEWKKRSLDTAIWITYSPFAWIEASVKLKATMGSDGTTSHGKYIDKRLEGQLKIDF